MPKPSSDHSSKAKSDPRRNVGSMTSSACCATSAALAEAER